MKKKVFRLLAACMCIVLGFSMVACSGQTAPVSDGTTTTTVADDGLGGDTTTSTVADDGLGGDISFDGTISTKADGSTDSTGSQGDNKPGPNSDKNPSSQGGFQSETPEADRLAVFQNIPKKLKGTSVTFATWGDEDGEEYKKVAKAFTKLTGINVKWQLYNQTTYAAEISRQIVAGKGPDVIILNGQIPQVYEIAAPLPEYFDVNDGFWDPRITEQTRFNGKNYFVNSYYSPYVPTAGIVVYNKRIFNDNGLTSPVDYIKQGQWTWENFRQCMVDAKKVGKYGGVLDPYLMALTMGPGFMSYDAQNSKVVCNPSNDAMLTSLKFYADCRAEGLCGNYLIAQYPSGNIAMLTTDAYAIKRNGYLKDMSASDYGAVRMPDSIGGVKCNYGGVGLRAYGIAKNAANPEGAYYFLRYFLDIDNCNRDANIFGNKEMQKFYTETVLKAYRENDLKISFMGPLELLNLNWTHSEIFKAMRRAPSEQMSVELQKIMNTFQAATDEANKKLASFK